MKLEKPRGADGSAGGGCGCIKTLVADTADRCLPSLQAAILPEESADLLYHSMMAAA